MMMTLPYIVSLSTVLFLFQQVCLSCKKVEGAFNEFLRDPQESEQIATDVSASGATLVTKDEVSRVEPYSTAHASLECGIWLAPSALHGAGLGMYAGKDFKKGELLQEVGDLCIPIIDINHHQMREGFKFLWLEYVWSGSTLGAHSEGFHDVTAASPGFGSAANSFLPLANVGEGFPRRDSVGLHRSKDPGAGAFSPYYDRWSNAERDIVAGEEFYVDYGVGWFKSRLDVLGPIPLENDLDKATEFFQSFQSIKVALSEVTPDSVFLDFWDTFVVNGPYNTSSRVFGSFRHNAPKEISELESGKTLKQLRMEEATRTQEWLQAYGTCGDHITAGPSTLTQAGHGAFASRAIPEGTIVAHVPLIHLTNRSRLNMFYFSKEHPKAPSLDAGKRPPQLLLNYCFGHGESTLLLCPYGPMVNYINHNQTQANVRIQWADPARGNFMPRLLNGSLEELETDSTAKLAFELVATRNIEKGEEVFLDYGDEWEQAWQEHVDTWTPVEGALEYVSLEELTASLEKKEIELYSEFDYLRNPNLPRIPPNVELSCNDYFSDDSWRPEYHSGNLASKLEAYTAEIWNCKILRTARDFQTGEVMYTVEARDGDDDTHHIWTDAPFAMFQFVEKPYTSDILLPNAFRHDIRIPDDVFPKTWCNLSPSYVKEN